MNIHYENTANKLRPKTFTELTGQEFVVSTICSSIEQNNVAPAYLFSGPRGVGKTSAARLVALAINRPENTPVDNLEYPGSEDIRLGKSLDVVEIDGASYTSVENVRSIREEILYAPVHFRYKVYIIDEVHMLSNSAFNALLKTIEEPPPYVVFIFATTELHKLPATIRSRCQQFFFKLISIAEICTKLEAICVDENILAESAALQWIAKESQGSFRDAYTLFDQVKAFSNNNISIESIKFHLGLAGLDTLNEIFLTCVQENRGKVLQLLGTLFSQGVAVEQFIMEAAEYLRNLLLLKSGIQSSTVLGYAPELFEAKVYDAISITQLERALAMLLACYKELRFSVNPRFEVELVFAQFCELSRYLSPQQLVTQLEQVREANMPSVELPMTSVQTRPVLNKQVPEQGTAIQSVQGGVPADSTERHVVNSMATVPTTINSTVPEPALLKTATISSPNSSTVPSSSLLPNIHELEGSLHDPTLQDIIDASNSSADNTNSTVNDIGNISNNGIENSTRIAKEDDVQESSDTLSCIEAMQASAIWAQIVSQIRTANEPLALSLDSAKSVQEGNSVSLKFFDDYSYNKYLSFEVKIIKLAKNITNADIAFYASLETTTSTNQNTTSSNILNNKASKAQEHLSENTPTNIPKHIPDTVQNNISSAEPSIQVEVHQTPAEMHPNPVEAPPISTDDPATTQAKIQPPPQTQVSMQNQNRPQTNTQIQNGDDVANVLHTLGGTIVE